MDFRTNTLRPMFLGSEDYYAMKNTPTKDFYAHLVASQAERERRVRLATTNPSPQISASYNDLPDKTKRAIWEHANRDAPGRIISLQYPEIKPPAKRSSMRRRMLHPFTSSKPKNKALQHKFVSAAPHTAFYHVDKLSREVALRYSQRLFPQHDRHDYITTDLSRDTIMLPALDYTVAEIAARYQLAVSSDQKYRLRYLVFESPAQLAFSNPMPELPKVEPGVIEHLYLSLSTCLDTILLVGGKGEGGSILEEASRVARVELSDIEAVDEPGTPHVINLDVQRDVYKTVRYHRMDLMVRYAHRHQSGFWAKFTIPFTLFYRDQGETLRIWDAEKEGYDVEVIGSGHRHRAMAWVEKVARQMAAVANEEARGG